MWRLRVYSLLNKLKYKRFIKGGIVGYIQKIMIMVILTLIVTFVISLCANVGFKTVLKFSTLAVAIIGVLSVLGGGSTVGSMAYTINKANSSMISATTEDIKLRHSSYSFCIFMGITAGILYIIYSLI